MKSISLFVLFWASINIHAVDNLRIPDIRSLGMGGNALLQKKLPLPFPDISLSVHMRMAACWRQEATVSECQKKSGALRDSGVFIRNKIS